MSVTFTYNLVSSTTMGLTVIDVKKPIIPPQKEILADVPKYNGLVQFSKKFTSNNIVVKSLLTGTSYADLITKLKALSAYLYSDEDEQLIFDDESDRYYLAQHIDTVIGKRTYRYCYLDLVFTCNDPFAYATSGDTDTQSHASKGFTYNITNSGQYYAYGTVTITFHQSQTHIYVENKTVIGSRFDISKAFVNNDVLVVNAKTMSITLNGTYSPAGFGDGGTSSAEFILLATGINMFEVGTDDGTLDATIVTTFSKTYFQ